MGKTQKTKLSNQIQYSRSEERFNIISHMVSAALALVGSVLIIIHATKNSDTLEIVAVVFYCLSLINLYTMSTLYHSQPVGKTRRSVFRRFDHCSIALLIAGTYAPYMIVGLMPAQPVLAIIITSLVTLMALLVIVFNAINVEKFKTFCMIGYVLMGWSCVGVLPWLVTAIGWKVFGFLVGGGVVYTVGILFYKSKSMKNNHAIWHVFTAVASILHFAGVWMLLG